MFKNTLIGVLAVGLLIFMFVAIRNSKPIECDDIAMTMQRQTLCIIELGDIEEDEVYEALQAKYRQQPIF